MNRLPIACRYAKRHERGQSLIESTLVMLAFFALLFGVIDCGQVVVAHEALVERGRAAVRWGVVHPWDGSGDQIANLILYNQTTEPSTAKDGFLGLKRENVRVAHQPPSANRPDDEMLIVTVVNYRLRFISPWIAQALVSPRPVLISAPMAYRVTAQN